MRKVAHTQNHHVVLVQLKKEKSVRHKNVHHIHLSQV